MLPALAWPAWWLVAGPHSNNISWSLSWLLARGAGRAGEGGMQTGSPGCGGAAVAGRGAGVRGHKQVSSALRWDM